MDVGGIVRVESCIRNQYSRLILSNTQFVCKNKNIYIYKHSSKVNGALEYKYIFIIHLYIYLFYKCALYMGR